MVTEGSPPKSPSEQLWANFADGIKGLKQTINDAHSKKVEPETLSNVVELAILRVFSICEDFVQELFYLCMLNDSSVCGGGSNVPVRTREEVDLLLMAAGGRRDRWVSWLPIDRTLSLAEMYLSGGHPFDRLRYRNTEKRALSELTIVRNSVAHPSSHAWEEFRKLAESKGYPTLRPADYLLSTRAGDQEVFLLMARVELIAKGLLATSDSEAEVILEPEASFQSNAKAPAGRYECLRCGHEVVTGSVKRLGACPVCESQEPCPRCGKLPTPRAAWRRTTAAAASRGS